METIEIPETEFQFYRRLRYKINCVECLMRLTNSANGVCRQCQRERKVKAKQAAR